MYVYRSTPIVSRMLITSWVRLVIWDTWSMMVDLRHGSRTAVPSGWAQEAHHLAVALHLSQVVRRLAWDARAAFWRGNSEKSRGCGQINQDKSCSQVKNNTQGICHAEFSISGQVWQVNAHGFDLQDPMFPFFKLWTRVCNKPRKSLRSTNLRSFLTGCFCS